MRSTHDSPTTNRATRAAVPAMLLVALGLCALLVHERSSRAELDNSVFTSIPDRVRVVVPRGWSVTDQPSYPGLLLWMLRTDPPGQIVVTSETLTHELYCSWSPACRTGSASLTDQYACAIREQDRKSTRLNSSHSSPSRMPSSA